MTTIIDRLPSVEDALLGVNFPEAVTACAYRLLQSDTAGDPAVIEVLMVIDHSTWDDGAIRTCTLARSIATSALASLEVIPYLVCRTRTENAEVAHREVGVWTTLRDASC